MGPGPEDINLGSNSSDDKSNKRDGSAAGGGGAGRGRGMEEGVGCNEGSINNPKLRLSIMKFISPCISHATACRAGSKAL